MGCLKRGSWRIASQRRPQYSAPIAAPTMANPSRSIACAIMVGMRARSRPACPLRTLDPHTLRGPAAPIGRTSCEADGKALHPCLTCRSTAWRDAGAVERGGSKPLALVPPHIEPSLSVRICAPFRAAPRAYIPPRIGLCHRVGWQIGWQRMAVALARAALYAGHAKARSPLPEFWPTAV